MKTKSIIVLLFAISFIFTSCCKMDQEVTPSANITTQKRAATDFNQLDVSGQFVVYTTISDEESVSVEANENLQRYISVSQYGEKLVVKLADNINIRNGEATMNVHIRMKELKQVSGAGAVNFQFQNEISGQELRVDLSGSSNLTGLLNLEQLNVSLSGASHLELSGHSDNFMIDASGASFLQDYSFETNYFTADLDGASEFHLTVNERMDITASGSSMIYYKGDGQINSQHLTGASKIVKVD